jgi:hypothetical protein
MFQICPAAGQVFRPRVLRVLNALKMGETVIWAGRNYRYGKNLPSVQTKNGPTRLMAGRL